MRVTYFGHSCFFVETAQARLIIDPFLTGNPNATLKAPDVRCDFILVSHGHEDHTGDALALVRNSPSRQTGSSRRIHLPTRISRSEGCRSRRRSFDRGR